MKSDRGRNNHQKHNPNTSRSKFPVYLSDSLTVSEGCIGDTTARKDTCFNHKNSSDRQLISSLVAPSHLTFHSVIDQQSSQKLDEMIPFPYYPYSYINFDAKENIHAQSYTPYFIPQAIPGVVPNYQPPLPPTSEVASSVVPQSNSTPVPSPPIPLPLFGTIPRPAFVANPDSSSDQPQFGPGPPIVTGERLKGPRGCNLFVFHLPNEISNW